MTNISMNLALPDQSATLGLPTATVKKHNNPFYEATELERAGKHKDAERIFLTLLNTDFDNPVLMAALGMNYAVAEKNGLAHVLLQTALANSQHILDGFTRLGITPKADCQDALDHFIVIKRSEILNAIGTCYKHENKTDKAQEYFLRAQEGLPENPDILNNLATLSINEGNPDDAINLLDRALSIDPNHGQAHWNRSLAYLEKGDYLRGWPAYDWGFKGGVRNERNQSSTPIPVWDGSKGKRVIVYGEQGIGDEIMFASMLSELIADCEFVVFECHRKLHKLLCNSFPGIDIYPTREDEMLTWPNRPDGTNRYNFTHKIAIGSLGQYYRKSLEEFPGHTFLRPTDASVEAGRAFIASLPAGRPNIGIGWTGGHKRTRLEVRSTTLEALLPILSQQANFISLQYTDSAEEIAKFEATHGIKIYQLPQATESPIYDDCAGLVSHLDLLVTVCTSAVHLAGSLGIPTWVMTPSRPAWRYRLDLDTMPWYASSVLFRQAHGSTEWEPVIDEIAESLKDMLACAYPNQLKEEYAQQNPDEAEEAS